MTRLRSLQEHLNRWMLAYVSLAMAGGLAIGYPAASTATSAAAAIGGLTGAPGELRPSPARHNRQR